MRIDIETDLYLCPKAIDKRSCKSCAHSKPHPKRTCGGYNDVTCDTYGGDCGSPCVSLKPDWNK